MQTHSPQGILPQSIMNRLISTFLLVLVNTVFSGNAATSPFGHSGDSVASNPLSIFPTKFEGKEFRVPEARFRIPNSFIPVHYEIRLRPILDDIPGDLPLWSAPGTVTIYGRCLETANNITLHSDEIVINETSVRVTNLGSNVDLAITGHEYDVEKTFYSILLGQQLQVGAEYKITIEYVARINIGFWEGMFRNHYDDPVSGQTIYSVATQLQAFGARRVFPCFDEPGLKATFKITLGRRSNYESLCNSPLLSSSSNPELEGWFWDDFNVTVVMPTYCVAIVISDFTYSEADPDIFHKPVRTYGPKHLIEAGYGDIPSEIGAHILLYFEQYFGIEYSMHKMDSVAVLDFVAGAMENWGLNIYSPDYLLYSPSQRNEKSRRGVALTLAHELAHQWAGNLVTCGWWTMAWLNEGFATYFSYQAMDYSNPEYEGRKAIQYDCLQRNAFRSDILPSSHPTVLPEKGNPWDTMTYDGNLVYSKGAALIRMMEGFLGLDTLQAGMSTFMKQYSFKAVNQDQFFQVMTDQAEEDSRLPLGTTIKDIMDTWTLQKGFPLVRVTSSGNSVRITQEEYKPDNETRVYFIPIAIATQSQPNTDNTIPQYWLYQQTDGITIQHNETEWVVINSGATGYYRVEYDSGLTEKIQNQLVLDHEVISLGSRSQFMDDYFTFAFARGSGVEAALGFTKYLAKEIESSVWNPFFLHMGYARRMLAGSSSGEAMKRYLLPRVSGALQTLINSGADLEVGAANLFYTDLADWSVALDNVDFLLAAMEYYEEWKRNPSVNPIPPALRQSVHCAAIAGVVTNDNFLFALGRFANETDFNTKHQILNGMGCRSDPASLNILLRATTGVTTEIPWAFAQHTLSSVIATPVNRMPTLRFLDENFEDIVTYFTSYRIISNCINNLSGYLSTVQDLTAITEFILKHNASFTDPVDHRIFGDAVRTLEGNIEWMEATGIPMGQWFSLNM